jgi:hypothetical protein
MTQVSRPMQIILLVTVLFGAVWFVALRPKSSSGSGGGAPAAQSAPDAPGAKGLTHAIAKAHGAVGTANAAGQRAAGETPVANGGATAAPVAHAPARPATHAKMGAQHAVRTHHRSVAVRAHTHRAAPVASRRANAVTAALRHHRAVAIAFYDPNAADSRLVASEIAHVSSFNGRALVLAVPIGELTRYDAITRQVQITIAPTTVVVDRAGHATTIVGYTDRVEIEQRLADALAAKR